MVVTAPRTRRAPRPRQARVRPPARAEAQRLDLEPVAARWQRALDAADGALRAGAAAGLSASELTEGRRALAVERRAASDALARLARAAGAGPAPWLSPVPLRPSMLGLPATAQACIFDLDGVLTDSGVLHAWAWGEVFDDFLLRLTDRLSWPFVPFDREHDYRAFMDGQPRIPAIRAFLESRGIRIPEGGPGDPAETDTAWGLARRKGAVLERDLLAHGTTALAGARRYLEALRARRPGAERRLGQLQRGPDAPPRGPHRAPRGERGRGRDAAPEAPDATGARRAPLRLRAGRRPAGDCRDVHPQPRRRRSRPCGRNAGRRRRRRR